MIELNKEYTYKQICEAIGWNVAAGNSKKAQIKEIESATEFYHPINNKTHKEKKSYIFTKQLREFIEPKHGGVRNTKSIQPMIDYLMMKVDPDNGYQSITTWLCDELLLMNKDTYNIPYMGKSEIESFCNEHHITNIKLFCDYVSTAKSIMKQMFLRALSSMEKQGLAEYDDGYMFTYKVGRRSKGHFSTDALNEIIKKNETDICNELQQEHGLTEKLSGRQLLLIIYGNQFYTEQFDDMKLSALMEDEEAVKIMDKCIDDIDTDIGTYCGRKYIGHDHPLLSYYRGVSIRGIEGKEYQDGTATEICNMVRMKARQAVLNKHYKNKYTGQVVYPYDKFECAADMVIIEKLLFEFYDENLVDDTALDLVELDEELEELFKGTISDGLSDIPITEEDLEQFPYLNEDSQDGNSETGDWGEPDAMDDLFTVEEILDMPTASDVVA